MSEEEALRELEKDMKKKEKAYDRMKGALVGMRTTTLSSADYETLAVFEAMIDGFKSIWNDIFNTFKLQIQTLQKVNKLGTKIEELETNIQQIREALDEEFHLFQGR